MSHQLKPKIINDKNVRAWVSTVFTSNKWSYSRKRNENNNVGVNWGLPAKGQLILKWPFGVFKSSKKPTKKFLRFSALASKKRSNKKVLQES